MYTYQKTKKTYLVQLDDVRVPYLLQDVDLASHALNVALALYLVLLKNLNRYFFASNRVCPDPHFSKGPLAQRFS